MLTRAAVMLSATGAPRKRHTARHTGSRSAEPGSPSRMSSAVTVTVISAGGFP